MSLVGSLIAFVVIWVVVLFTVLPWGNRPPDDPEPGHATSAPENPRIGLKFAVTTAITMVLFAILYVIVTYHLIELPSE